MGPIAEKLIRDINKVRKQKIIDLSAMRSARERMGNVIEARNKHLSSDIDPLHAIYVDMQHRIVDFFEQFSMLPYSIKFSKNYDAAEDFYMPSGPPMSPVTYSFFISYFAFDLGIGLKKETITSVMIDLYSTLGADQSILHVLKLMQDSYNGLYMHDGYDEGFIYLKEIYTNQTYKVFNPSGYQGYTGEIWLVRLLPSPFQNLFDYSITFTTPYIIMDMPGFKKDTAQPIFAYTLSIWLEFIERNLLEVKVKNDRYRRLMKHGLAKHYWLEYVTLAYVNHRSDMILLTGFPDQPATLPHHPSNERHDV